MNNKRTNRPAEMKFLDGEKVVADRDEDPREKLADWLTDRKNPFFAEAVANRYWEHFFGRGITDPADDMRATNPPSNPELLAALAKHFVEDGYSLKKLVKTICKSRAYELSSIPNETNASDRQSFARYSPKRLPAEVVVDAVCTVTGTPFEATGLPRDRHGPNRALMLPDEAFPSYFLDVFGRPQRISACGCERVNEANLAMTLHNQQPNTPNTKIARGDGRAAKVAIDTRPDDEKIEELFLLSVGHKPTEKQLAAAKEQLAKHADNKRIAYENIIWALINSKAFLFNQ